MLSTLDGAQVDAAVTVASPKPGQGTAADLLKESLGTTLVASGYDRVPAVNEADISIQASYSGEVFDRSGNYVLYDGTASAQVIRLADRKVLSQTRFVERGPRTLEDDRALEANVLQVADRLSGWMSGALSPAKIGIAASNVTVSNHDLTPKQYPRRFIDAVSATEGVTAARYLGLDQGGDFVFRVVYFPDQVPEGLLTRLRSIQGLNIR